MENQDNNISISITTKEGKLVSGPFVMFGNVFVPDENGNYQICNIIDKPKTPPYPPV
jgi:hypothetical protein